MLPATRPPVAHSLQDPARGVRARLRGWAPALPFLAHGLAVVWLFKDALTGAGVFYFRDITAYYFPEYTFVARALAQGVWPLWNPAADGGGPYLMGYPVNLLLAALGSPRAALALAPPLHVLLAACGATVLALALGYGRWGAWLAGAAYALSGSLLGQSFFPNFHAAAWAPWIFAVLTRHDAWPARRWTGALALLAAMQASTFGGEVVLQTALLAPVLVPAAFRGWPAWRRLIPAGALAALLVAPVLLGTWAIVEGTQRGQGFDHAVAFGYSATPLTLVDALLPRFFGDLHTFSDVGFWGQPHFRAGYPYIPSLYLGTVVLVLAALAGRSRLWIVAALGVLMSLGDHGPLEPALVPLLTVFRAPVKFFYLTAAAVALLAGLGLDRAVTGRVRARAWVLLPGLALAAGGMLLALRPGDSSRWLAAAVSALADPRAQFVVRNIWPWEWLRVGLAALAAALALVAGRRLAPFAAVVAVFDLLVVNAALNPVAPRGFFDLQPPMRALVADAAARGTARWFSYGVLSSPGLHWHPSVALANSDRALYAATRQSLVPITHELDGLEAAFDLDHMGWAPEGSTLTVEERTPARYAEIHRRLRLANVRWVLAFQDLPEALVEPRGEARLREIVQPLRLFELRDALPRAFWVGRAEVLADRAALLRRLEDPSFEPRTTVALEGPGPAALAPPEPIPPEPPPVTYERVDPHTVRLRASTPPGYLVVLDGYHRSWRAEGPGGPAELLRANGRYWALPTRGGDVELTVRYRPSWRAASLAAAALALLAATLLTVAPRTPRGASLDRVGAPR